LTSPDVSEGTLRTCVGCRRKRRQADLLRFQRRRDGEVIPAIRPGAGRSAYLCPSRTCYDLAVRRKGLARSLSGPAGLTVRVDSNILWSAVGRSLEREVELLQHTAIAPGRLMTTLTALQVALSQRNEGA